MAGNVSPEWNTHGECGWCWSVNGVAPKCWCANCHHTFADELRQRSDANDLRWFSITQHMYLCPDCGNKRCPKATNHVLACTGSNTPGQAGSAYA